MLVTSWVSRALFFFRKPITGFNAVASLHRFVNGRSSITYEFASLEPQIIRNEPNQLFMMYLRAQLPKMMPAQWSVSSFISFFLSFSFNRVARECYGKFISGCKQIRDNNLLRFGCDSFSELNVSAVASLF